ncbi:RDD family protein [Massilia forsythiae]|uniref:RDD family protein n=1 Tax=Massilia forsythiae TaxID=2728020 RepID=A0A7Z2VXK9_9BURK|nr:RDD family protein [Massilia forsythiae]QJE01313.1 RDD family protein [Massilia forsythiae]
MSEPTAPPLPCPSIRRRLVAMVYESFLLAAVEMLAVALWLALTRNHHEPVYQYGLKVFLFLVTGAYFVHAWSGSGHTLAMKTWRMRLLTDGGARVPLRTAVLRYLLAWGWFLPALAVCALFGVTGKAQVGIVVGVGIVAWGATALLDPQRRFLHDRLAGTRLVSLVGRPAVQAVAS